MAKSNYDYIKKHRENSCDLLQTLLPKDLAKRFSDKCKELGVSKNSVINKGIKEFMENE